MSWELHRHDARNISELLPPESVDAVITSPPYFALRSYRDECEACGGDGVARPGVEAKPPPDVQPNNNGKGGSGLINSSEYIKGRSMEANPDGCPACNGTGRSHYDGQIGSEPTPTEFLDALIACTADWLKVLKPGGSLWVNLGDKYSQRVATRMSSHQDGLFPDRPELVKDWKRDKALGMTRMPHQNIPGPGIPHVPEKSLMGLPWRYAIRCIDELGLILRAEVIWSKPNGLPESVTDRVRRSHEQWFHFTRQGRYFAAIDEVREAYDPGGDGFRAMKARWTEDTSAYHVKRDQTLSGGHDGLLRAGVNPLGKAPGSVWSIASEPLVVPDELGVDHFAAFPSELPRRIILGWSPSGYCTACDEPRRAVVDKTLNVGHVQVLGRYRYDLRRHDQAPPGEWVQGSTVATITGYACACPTPDAPTRPAVVLDPFAGTGTTVAVAHLLGRHGIGTDLSADYLRLAEWRCTSDQRLRDKVLERSGIPNPAPPKIDGQLGLFEDEPEAKPPWNPPIRWRNGDDPAAPAGADLRAPNRGGAA